jgi:rhamnosyltransferase
MSRIAGIVVLYNPNEDVVKNVNSYDRQVEKLFVIDNSEYQNRVVIKELTDLKTVEYRWNGKNIGIAKALNIGATLALDGHYDSLLMMDQDSVAPANIVQKYCEYVANHATEAIGICCPRHELVSSQEHSAGSKFTEVLVANTAGTILNLNAYQATGSFMDELFIDYVDFEYCLHLHLNGFKIIQLNEAIIEHTPGNQIKRRFLFWQVGVSNHSPMRVYYRIRNRFFVIKKYYPHFPLWSIKEMIITGNELLKIICFENNKREKFKMAFMGIRDFLAHRLGKCRY